MSYGSIKRPPSEAPASVAPPPAPKPQPPVPKPESTDEHLLPETNYATGDQQKPVDQVFTSFMQYLAYNINMLSK